LESGDGVEEARCANFSKVYTMTCAIADFWCNSWIDEAKLDTILEAIRPGNERPPAILVFKPPPRCMDMRQIIYFKALFPAVPTQTFLAAAWTALLLFAAVAQAHADKRVALVIGNDRYVNLPEHEQLQKAVNDSRAVGQSLAQLGFASVAIRSTMRSTARKAPNFRTPMLENSTGHAARRPGPIVRHVM
jgi:hypothetical protein